MTKQQLTQDIEFLAQRQLKAGTFSHNEERDFGQSSNSIVAIVYGILGIESQVFPSDFSDLAACERMWEKLPDHRKTGDGIKAMEAARGFEYFGKIINK